LAKYYYFFYKKLTDLKDMYALEMEIAWFFKTCFYFDF